MNTSSDGPCSTEMQSFHYSDIGASGAVECDRSGEDQQRAVTLARAEGEAQAKARFDQQVQGQRDLLRSAIAQFSRERQIYFRKVEGEVLQLALAIARKVLQREAQIDPLLLAGLVRLAVDDLQAATLVSLRVHPSQAASWREYFAHGLDPQEAPKVIEDPALQQGDCVLETSGGSTHLGIEPQLKEIEQGMLDLLAQRPTTPTAHIQP